MKAARARLLGEDPLVQRTAARWRGALERLDVNVAATFTADPLVGPFVAHAESLRLEAAMTIAPYHQVHQQLLDIAGVLRRPATANLLLIRPEDFQRREATDGVSPPTIEARAPERVEADAAELVDAIVAASSEVVVPFVVAFCPPSPQGREVIGRALLESIEERAERTLAACPTVTLVRSDALGLGQTTHDPHRDRLAHVPFKRPVFDLLARALLRRLHALTAPPIKVLAVDCDNTLWRGVCGELGADGVAIGSGQLALQAALVAQHDAGRLVCLVSKNVSEDVEAVFATRDEMPLRLEHVVAMRVNWRTKSENLADLADELNVSLDSFVFVDDNPVELAEVEAAHPEVLTVAVPEVDDELEALVGAAWVFDPPRASSTAARRTKLYRDDMARRASERQAPTLGAFLARLELEVAIEPLSEAQLTRAAELTQRTNQFNATTVRRTEGEIRELLEAPHAHGLLIRAKDRFGDYGIVGELLYRSHPEHLEVDTFLLSCRALGRGIEHRMLAKLGELARAGGQREVVVPFVPTHKNEPAQLFFEAIGGCQREQRGEVTRFRYPVEVASGCRYAPPTSRRDPQTR